jgi:drug/metabolite transporter (DMT)-like permease
VIRHGDAERRGTGWYALSAAALFGLSTPVSKWLLARVSPLTLAGLLYLGSGLGLGLFLAVRRAMGSPSGLAVGRAHVPRLLATVLMGGLLAPIAMMLGLSRVSSTAASLLLNIEGVFNVALAAIVLREAMARRSLSGIALILVGAGLVGFSPGSMTASLAGALLVALSCLGWALDNTLTTKLSHLDPIRVAVFKGLLAAPLALAAARLLGERLPSPPVLAIALLVGTLSYGASLACFILSLRTIGLARTGAIFATAPFIGAIASSIALRERPTVAVLCAGALMALGVRLLMGRRAN